jgi:TusA-related sulfurtransferase
MPILKTNTAIKKMESGQILEMLATDPGAKPDMVAWSKRTKHELLGMEEGEGGVLRFYVRKTA